MGRLRANSNAAVLIVGPYPRRVNPPEPTLPKRTCDICKKLMINPGTRAADEFESIVGTQLTLRNLERKSCKSAFLGSHNASFELAGRFC